MLVTAPRWALPVSGSVPRWSLRRRAAAGLLIAGGVAVWLVAGAPWWAPALLLAGGLVGRMVAVVMPARYRVPMVRGGVLAAAVWLAAGLSPSGWVFIAGLVTLAVLVSSPPGNSSQSNGTGRAARLAVGVGAVVLLVGGIVGAVVEQAEAARALAEVDAHAGDLVRAQMLPASPSHAVAGLLRAIAEDDPAAVCRVFSPSAAAQLAAAHSAVDCADAVHRLRGQVRDPDRYARPDRGTMTETVAPDGQTGTGNGCALTWTGLPRLLAPDPTAQAPAPGPQPGELDGQRQLGQGYLVTAYRPC